MEETEKGLKKGILTVFKYVLVIDLLRLVLCPRVGSCG